MTALRPSLLAEREPLDLPRASGTTLLCLFAAAWLHLIFFVVWEKRAGLNPELALGFMRVIELPADIPPLEMEIELTAEEAAIPEAEVEAAPVSAPAEAESPAAPTVNPAEAVESSPAETLAEAETLALARALADDPALAQLSPAAEGGDRPADFPPPVTVESEIPQFKSYKTIVRRTIYANWLIPPEAAANFRPGRLVVNCAFRRDGALLSFVVQESTGSAILDHAGLEALRAAPLPPFPPELAASQQLEMTIIFDYQARYLSRAAAASQP